MRLKWAMVVVALCVVVTLAAVAYAAGKASDIPEVIRAQRFELVDGESKTLAVLGLEGMGNPSLVLLDRRGAPRVQLSHQPDAFRGGSGGTRGSVESCHA